VRGGQSNPSAECQTILASRDEKRGQGMESNDTKEAMDSLNNTTNLMKSIKGIDRLCFWVRYFLIAHIAYRLANGFWMGVLYFLGISIALFFVGMAICQASRLLYLNRNPIQREAYLMNCVLFLPIVMTGCLLVYVVMTWN